MGSADPRWHKRGPIEHANYRREFGGWETAAIKFHNSVDTVIEGNLITLDTDILGNPFSRPIAGPLATLKPGTTSCLGLGLQPGCGDGLDRLAK